MSLVRDLSVRRRLTLIGITTTFTALLLACAAFVASEQVTYRRSMVSNLAITARMIAFNTTSALSFDDAGSAEQTLQSLAAQPHLVSGCVYDEKGQIFAKFQRDARAAPAWPAVIGSGADFGRDSLRLFQDIELAGEKIGTIYLESDLVELRTVWRNSAFIAAGAMALAILLSFLLGRRLQQAIVQPVSALAAAMAGVSSGEKRYSIRVARGGRDELGQLVDGFNSMLAQIGAREADLRKAQAELESRVKERTRELVDEMMQRQRTEEERDRFFTLSLDLLCICGFDGILRRRNPAIEQVLGFRDEDLGKVPFLQRVHPEDRAVAERELGRLARGEPVHNQELRMESADGTYRWIAWSCTPVLPDACFYAYGRDITDRKSAEQERETLHGQLLDISRQAGMAEVATSVLHNVGNVLNSVNVSATLVLDQVRGSRLPSLAKLVELVQEQGKELSRFLAEDPRGQQVPGFLQLLSQHLAMEQSVVMREVESLRKNIEHIKEIVAMQQNYARISGVVETVAVTEMVEDAVQMNAGALQRHGVALVRDYRDRPTIVVEKHKVLQILVNLIRNAKYACDEAQKDGRTITLRIEALAEHVEIVVSDNGVGIPRENLTRIFNHGFTTRAHGHGFGLHSGALVAQELGGGIHAASDGPGTGATFTVRLPYRPKQALSA